MIVWALIDGFQGYLSDTVALAAVAVIGYLFGRRSHKSKEEAFDVQLHQELSRATNIAKELQQIAGRIRNDVASHQSNISQFKSRVSNLQENTTEDGWQTLGSEAESLLIPTMKLATELSQAYDQLRKQSLQLMNFAGSRTDPHTGLNNRRAMEEQLDVLFSLHEQNASRFSLALFSFECCAKDPVPDEQLIKFVAMLEGCARDTDVVARYSGEEFVVLMPQTSLAGGMIFSERLLNRASALKQCVIAGGIVEVCENDDSTKMLSRADSALYSARAKGYSCLYQHNGKTIREHEVEIRSGASNVEYSGLVSEDNPVSSID